MCLQAIYEKTEIFRKVVNYIAFVWNVKSGYLT